MGSANGERAGVALTPPALIWRFPMVVFAALLAAKYTLNLFVIPYPVDRFPNADAAGYVQPARHLWQTGSMPTIAAVGPSNRPPGYFTIIAPLLLFGDSYRSINVSTRIVNVAADLVVVMVLYWLSCRMAPSFASRTAVAALLGLQPWTSRALVVITPDTITMLLVFTGAMLLAAVPSHKPQADRVGLLLLGSLTVNSTFLFRPEMILLAPFLVSALLFLSWGSQLPFWRSALLSSLPFFLVLSLNVAYRWHFEGSLGVFGSWSYRESGLVRWTETWSGPPRVKNAIVWGWYQGRTRGVEFEDVPPRAFDTEEEKRTLEAIYEQRVAQGIALDSADHKRLTRIAEQRIRRSPLRYYLSTGLYNTPRYWLEVDAPADLTGKVFWGIRNLLGRRFALAAYMTLKVVTLASCLVGIGLLLRPARRAQRQRIDSLILAGLAFAVARTLFFAFILSHIDDRYTIPAWPFVLLAACVAITAVVERLGGGSSGRIVRREGSL